VFFVFSLWLLFFAFAFSIRRGGLRGPPGFFFLVGTLFLSAFVFPPSKVWSVPPFFSYEVQLSSFCTTDGPSVESITFVLVSSEDEFSDPISRVWFSFRELLPLAA